MAVPLMTAFVRIRPDMSGFKKETEAGVASTAATAEKAGGGIGSKFGGAFKKYSNLAMVGLGVGAFEAVKKTLGDARALGLAPLKLAVKNAGDQWGTFQRQLTPVQARMEKLGFTNADVNHGLERLITSTDNTQLSMRAMATAADYARFKHISLEDASIALGRAAVGNTRALKDVGIATNDLPKHFSTTGTAASRLNTVMGLLNKKIGGEGTSYAKTYGGRLEILKAQTTDLSAKFGSALLPILGAVAGVLVKLTSSTAGTYALATGVAAIAAAFVGAKIAALLFVDSTKGALISSGIGAALVLIGVAAYLIISHWKQISKVAGEVWGHVLSVIRGVWDWIKKYWPYLLTVIAGPIGLAAALIIKHWSAVRRILIDGAHAVAAILTAVWHALAAATRLIWEGIRVYFVTYFKVLRALFTFAWTAIRVTVTTASKLIRVVLTAAWKAITVITRATWNALRAYFTAYWKALRLIFTTAVSLIRVALAAAWRAISGTARDVWNALRAFFTNWWRGMRNLYHDAVTGIRDMLSGQWNRMHDDAVSVWQNLVKRIGQIWNGIKNAIRDPVNWVISHVIDGLIGAFNWVSGHVGGPKIKPVPRLAKGGRLPGYGGGDRHPALLESGEAVVPKHLASSGEFAAWARASGIPGYARGGRVGQNPPHPTGNPHLPHGQADPGGGIGGSVRGFFGKIGDIGKITAAVFSGNTRALTNAMADMIPGGTGGAVASLAGLLTALPRRLLALAVKDLIGIGAASGSGAAIVNYAMRFLGKIPYVWGGTSVPGGADCSGFTQAVYGHFGIRAPRTSEAQSQWVKRMTSPQAGGLAFYHSPPGGPDPGHVAIIRNAKQVISQGGGMGPKVENIAYMPLLSMGIPPGGFGGGAHGLVPANAAAISAYLRAHGASKAASAGILGNIYQESGGNPAIGLIQILGDKGGSLSSELAKTLAYINANGSIADINAHSQSATSAAVWFSDRYERPGIPQIQTRIASARASFAAGYARGGLITEPIAGVGLRSGRQYSLGEAGDETVIPGRFSPGGIERRLDQLIRIMAANAAQTAAGLAGALDGAAGRAANRSRYGTGY